jgi:hypothetical protein
MNMPVRAIPATASVETRIEMLDWPRVFAKLDAQGWAAITGLLSPTECRVLAAAYDDDTLFRARVVLARHGLGRGEYKCFAYPLPDLVVRLRASLYARLAPLANCWNQSLKSGVRYPVAHADFIERCRDADRTRPTPLLLRHAADDYGCLQQDAGGEHSFPLQAAVLLGEPQADFTGGEFVLMEQRPRLHARVEVVTLRRGDAVIFAGRARPAKDSGGSYRANMNHAVSRVRSGRRHALAVIFHDSD